MHTKSIVIASLAVAAAELLAVPADPLPPRSVTYWDDNLVFDFPLSLPSSSYDASWRILLQNRDIIEMPIVIEKQRIDFKKQCQIPGKIPEAGQIRGRLCKV